MFNTINQLKLDLYIKDYLTSDSFYWPDREYIFLDELNNIKFMRADSVVEIFDFERYKNIDFRKIKNY